MTRRVLSAAVIALTLSVLLTASATFEQITVANSAIGFTAAKIDPPGEKQKQVAVCRLRLAEISYTWDGTTPTASVGMLLEVGDTLTLYDHTRLAFFRAIRTTGVSGQLDCTYDP